MKLVPRWLRLVHRHRHVRHHLHLAPTPTPVTLRAGVPRSTAMSIVGHQTQSIYTCYAIQDEAMQQEAARRLDAWTNSRAAVRLISKNIRNVYGDRGAAPTPASGPSSSA